MRYDIYIDGSILKSVKKDWQPYIINPDLYADGNISLPDMHDLLLFAGMYPYLSEEDRNKVETIAVVIVIVLIHFLELFFFIISSPVEPYNKKTSDYRMPE